MEEGGDRDRQIETDRDKERERERELAGRKEGGRV